MSWDATLYTCEDRPPVSEPQLAWIAGILEGEGCFRLRRQFPAARSWRAMLDVQVNMTDEDVVRRLHEVSKLGTFHGPYGGKPPRKPFWVWKVSASADAQALMEAMLPWMGQRRSAHIRSIIAEYRSQPERKQGQGFRLRKSDWLVRVRLDEVASFNYTHNTNGMIAAAYEAVSGEVTKQCDGPLGRVIGAAWWDRLDGAAGEDGKAYLSQVITGLEADPDRYRAMNPPNGWGSYDGLLGVLREMRDAVPDGEASVWSVSG